MSRGLLRILLPLGAVLLSAVLAVPAAATGAITVVDAERLRAGAVRVAVEVTCDPLGPDSQAFLSLTLWQGNAGGPRYVEGSVSYGEIGGASLTCDGTAHTYRLTVLRNPDYAGRWFWVGRARTESAVQVCTLVAPNTYSCSQAGATVIERISIHR